MRIAALYDIHGNLPALEVVLQDIREAEVDRVVVGGDALLGPMPRDTLECLLNLDIPVEFIHGNTDRTIIKQMAAMDKGREKIRWVAQQLYPEYEQLLKDWPLTIQVQTQGLGRVLFCHATPRSDTEVFNILTPEDILLPVFEGLNASVIVCGHTHMQFDRMIAGIRVVNAGSVGMPIGEPGSYWLLLDSNIELRHTPYDIAEAAKRIQDTKYPLADDFAVHNVLQPPSKENMLERYAQAE